MNAKTVVIVEDDPDIQVLIETIFSMDPRFRVAGMAASAEEAIDLAKRTEPEIIVLDHSLEGELNGVEAVPRFKQVAPTARIIVFTAHADLQAQAANHVAVDAFLLKTDTGQLLPLAQQLTNMLSLL